MVSTTSEAVSFAVSDPIISELTVGIVNKFIAHARKIPGLADITIKDTEQLDIEGEPVIKIKSCEFYFDPITGAVITTDSVISKNIMETQGTTINKHDHGPFKIEIERAILRQGIEVSDLENEKGDASVILPLYGVDTEGGNPLSRWEGEYSTRINGIGESAAVFRKEDFNPDSFAGKIMTSLRKISPVCLVNVKAFWVNSCPALLGRLSAKEARFIRNLTIGFIDAEGESISFPLVWEGTRSDFTVWGAHLPRFHVPKMVTTGNLEAPTNLISAVD